MRVCVDLRVDECECCQLYERMPNGCLLNGCLDPRRTDVQP